MKNKAIASLLIIICVSCNNNNNSGSFVRTKNDSIQHSKNPIENAIEFLKLFKDIEPLGIHFYPMCDSDGKITKTPFEGITIDVNKFSYVNDSTIFLNIRACKKGESMIFAIGKFDLNDKYLGLITRQFSQYDESLIQLMLWNKMEKRITKGIDLAVSFGDEGWWFDKESWITEYAFNKKLSIVSRKKDFTPEDDNTKSSITDSMLVSHFDGSKFKTLNIKKSDTIHFKLKQWR